MDPQPAFTFQDLFTVVIRDMAKAVAERNGETEQQQFARSQAAAHMILAFLPRDVIEAMLAGHCVMLHEVMTANVHDTLCTAADPARRGPRSNVVGLNKAFNDNLDRLERYRQRPAEGSRDVPEVQPAKASPPPPNVQPPPTSTAELQPPRPVAQTMNRAARRQAARAEIRDAAAASRAVSRPAAVTPQPAVQASPTLFAHPTPDLVPPEIAQIDAIGSPLPEAIAACNANPEAMAALNSGDPAGFARAMGIAHPGEGFLAAANAKGSPFDPHSSGPWPTGAIAPAPKA